METSLKTGFAQIFSCCPKNLSCPNFGGAAVPLAPPRPGPYAYDIDLLVWVLHSVFPRLHLKRNCGIYKNFTNLTNTNTIFFYSVLLIGLDQ